MTINAAQNAQQPDPNVEYVRDNDVVRELIIEQIQKEEEKILKNRVLLHNLEISLNNAIERGMVEKEKCIRQSITSLRTINYVYNWVLNQIEKMDYSNVRLSSVESMDRIKYLNKLFMDVNYKIDDCYLKNIKTGLVGTNEMTKYAVDRRSDIIKQDLVVKEEYKAARCPFR